MPWGESDVVGGEEPLLNTLLYPASSQTLGPTGAPVISSKAFLRGV